MFAWPRVVWAPAPAPKALQAPNVRRLRRLVLTGDVLSNLSVPGGAAEGGRRRRRRRLRRPLKAFVFRIFELVTERENYDIHD